MIRYFISHPTAANLLMLLLLMLGLVSLPRIHRETLPQIQSYQLDIQLPYPGATPENILQKVCLSLENALDGISFLQEQQCMAQQNLAVMTVKMSESGDFSRFTTDVKNALDRIDDLPPEVEQWTITERGRTQEVVSVAVAADLDRVALKALAEQIKAQLLRHPDISLVDIKDFSPHQLQIRATQQTMRQYDLSLPALAQQLRQQNIELPLGVMQTPLSDTQIRLTEEQRDVEGLGRLRILSGAVGNELQLAQLAQIQDGFERDDALIFYQDKAAAVLVIRKNTEQDSLKVLAATEQVLSFLRQSLPHGITLAITNNNTAIVQDRIQLLLTNAWQGLLLVFLVVWLFFSLRYTFWVVMGLPVAFAASFFLMLQFGITINMLSMVALLLALGILMDDAIVIAESIGQQLSRGLPLQSAVLQGTLVVLPGILSSCLTTLCVFVGLIFIEGDLGQVLKVIPMVLIPLLLVSLLEALLIMPRHLHDSLSAPKRPVNATVAWLRSSFEQQFARWNDRVYHLNIRLIQYRYLLAGAVVALFVLSVSVLASGRLKFTAFPDIDGDVVQARLLLPGGTPLQTTQALMQQVQQALMLTSAKLSQSENQPLVQAVTLVFGENPDVEDQGSHLAYLSVDLLSAEQRHTQLQQFIQHWQAAVGTLSNATLNFTEPRIGPQGRAIDVRFTGPDLAQLQLAAQEFSRWLAGYSGVLNIHQTLRPGKPEFTLQLKSGALSLGIDASMIASQLRAAFQGYKVAEIYAGQEAYEIVVKLAKQSMDDFADFEQFPIIHPQTKQTIPLSALVDVRQTRGFAVLHRFNQQPSVSVYADVDASMTTAKTVLTAIGGSWFSNFHQQFPTVSYQIEGEVKNAAITQASIRRAFLAGLAAIFLLLALQFRSYIEPLIVIVAIPFALIGVVFGHVLMGIHFSMPSLMGFVSLAGIVVNNSILLVQFVKTSVSQGMSVPEAAAKASHDRFRAIVMTSVTTIAGMTPLLFETSVQAQILIPLATSVVFGLLASTCLVLLLLPCLYTILADFQLTAALPSETKDHGLEQRVV